MESVSEYKKSCAYAQLFLLALNVVRGYERFLP